MRTVGVCVTFLLKLNELLLGHLPVALGVAAAALLLTLHPGAMLLALCLFCCVALPPLFSSHYIQVRTVRACVASLLELDKPVEMPCLCCNTHTRQQACQVQDEEDAKKGMYNWFAQSQRLLTGTRLALATLFTAGIALALTDSATAGSLLALCVLVYVAAWQYSYAIIGGVVGDFLGAAIAVTEILIYLFLAIDWQVRSSHCFDRCHRDVGTPRLQATTEVHIPTASCSRTESCHSKSQDSVLF